MSSLLWHTWFLLFDSTSNIRFYVWRKRKGGRERRGGGQVKLSVVYTGMGVIAFSFCFDVGGGGGVKNNFENGSRSQPPP